MAVVKERPILFSGAMVRAILDGRKTQTRRVVKPGPGQKWLTPETIARVKRWEHRGDGYWSMQVGEPNRIVHCGIEMDGGHIGCIFNPYGVPGDRLWVRESWLEDRIPGLSPDEHGDIHYRATSTEPVSNSWAGRWRPSIYMPRWASRITLEVTGLRVERLHEIDYDDAIAEGLSTQWDDDGLAWLYGPSDQVTTKDWSTCPIEAFSLLWDSINAKRGFSWASNPWVWVVGFRRV